MCIGGKKCLIIVTETFMTIYPSDQPSFLVAGGMFCTSWHLELMNRHTTPVPKNSTAFSVVYYALHTASLLPLVWGFLDFNLQSQAF